MAILPTSMLPGGEPHGRPSTRLTVLFHSIIDTVIPSMNVNALYGGGSAQTWANTLAARITSGEYESLADGWISNINTTALSGTSIPTSWASEANAYDCRSSGCSAITFSSAFDACH